MGEEDEAAAGPRTIPYVTIDAMTPQVRNHITANTPFDCLWTDDWSPRFYRAQARLGFIAVANRGPGDRGNVLIPELQREYAVLDWPNLAIDRGVRRIIDAGRLERENIRLRIDPDPADVLEQLSEAWEDSTWLLPEYVLLVKRLASKEEQGADPGFRILATTLAAGDDVVAGELGYAVGRAYVSLSGFLRQERREWNHLGKLQMVLLALRLEAAGFGFWNLGHPYMDYKTRLGAAILPRGPFLRRWDEAVRGGVPRIAVNGRECLEAAEIVMLNESTEHGNAIS